MAKWLPPHGFTGKVHHIRAEVGGTYKMSFTNLTIGHSHSFGGEFVELVPSERIRHTDRFDDPNLPGQMQTTITLKKVVRKVMISTMCKNGATASTKASSRSVYGVALLRSRLKSR